MKRFRTVPRAGGVLAIGVVAAGCAPSPPAPSPDSASAAAAPVSAPTTSSSPRPLLSGSASAPGSEAAPPHEPLAPARDRLLSCSIAGACVVDSDGSVRCWGGNHAGRVGIGIASKTEVKPGRAVVDLPPARSVAAGLRHTCALTKDGAVFCWGANESGETGDGAAIPPPDAPGPSPSHPKPVRVGGLPAPAIALDAGPNSTCVALATGDVYCWGSNNFGELGASGPASSKPQKVPTVSDAAEVSMGVEGACARSSRGEVWCWGTLRGGGATPPTVEPGLCARQITMGSGFGCAVDCTGAAVCFGGGPGRSGAGSTLDRTLAPAPTSPVGVEEIRAGLWHVCLRIAGRVSCWGGNDAGQLGGGMAPDWSQDFQDQPQPVHDRWAAKASAEPVSVRELCASGMNIRPDPRYRRPATFVEAGATCALTSADDVYCWGEPSHSYEPVFVTHRK